MLDIFRDPLWQFIGAAFTICTVIISVILLMIQRRKKQISYEILVKTPLFNVKEAVKDKIQILFESKPVENVYLIMIRIYNSGNMPITSTDYERPINISFGKNTHILSVDIYETFPNSFLPIATIKETKVILEPTLINSGDSVTLKMLISQVESSIKVDGRIIGIKELKESLEGETRSTLFMLSGLVLIIFGFVEQTRSSNVWPTVMFFIGLVLALFGMFTDPKSRKRKLANKWK